MDKVEQYRKYVQTLLEEYGDDKGTQDEEVETP